MTERPYAAVIATPLPGGQRLGLQLREGDLVSIDFLPFGTALVPPSRAAVLIVRELERYFRNPGAAFSVPLRPAGTPFQLRVWQALRQLPAASTVSYGELAGRLRTSARAIGGACRANPIPIIVPCHRVTASGGLGGYMGACDGDPFAIKEWLLRHEGGAVGGV